MVNHTHDALKVPYDHILTALTYMRGPLINDWVDQQEKKLADRTDTSKINWVHEDNEILWTEFETDFLAAWTDTSKKQNAYDQLMRLTMNGWDVDTYIATLDRLTLAAGWDSNSEGTIAKFREGLSKGIHSKALDCDRIPALLKNEKQQHERKLLVQRRSTTQDLLGTSAETPRNLERTQTCRPRHTHSRIQTIPE